MTRPQREMIEMNLLLAQLVAGGEGAPTIEQKMRMVEALRGQSAEVSKQVDRSVIEQLCRLHGNLAAATRMQRELVEIHERLTAPPFYPAVFLAAEPVGKGSSAMVMCGNSRRVVTCGEDVDPGSLEAGDEVLLSHELNFIVARSPYNAFQSGCTGYFERYTSDGRIVLKDRDEEVVVDVAGRMKDEALKSGDQIRWERNSCMALEKIERPKADALFLEETPSESFDDIGGLDRQIEQLQRPIRLHFFNRDVAARYRLRRVGSVLLSGPPGTGKTMMARALANWLAKLAKSGRARFMHIKPLELSSMWYSESERNIRNTFRMAREAGEKDQDTPVLMFIDEADSIGSSRGASWMQVDDKVLTALMTELDGLEARGNVLVVAATNRKASLDAALMRQGRLGDLVIEIPRPNMKAASEIFAKHLPEGIPYNVDGDSGEGARRYIIQSAVSRIYSPNGESELVQIGFRDGKQRVVKAGDLMNGASIAKIVRIAVERACQREIEGGPAGVRLEDIFDSIADEFDCLARMLSPANCRNHLSDLPQDVDVVRVEPMKKKVSRSHRYINAA